MDKIVSRLGEAIKKCNLSYAELEKKTNISKSALQRYASGKTKKIPLDVITSLAPVLGVTPQYLMGWDDEKKEQNNESSRIWKNVKKAREKINISQEELAKRSNATPQLINAIEKNIKIPSYELIVKLAKALNCEVSYLFFGDELNSYDFTIMEKIDDIMASDDEARKKVVKASIEFSDEDIMLLERIIDALNTKKAD